MTLCGSVCTGTVTATLYTVIDDPTGTKKLNVPVVGVGFFYDFLANCS